MPNRRGFLAAAGLSLLTLGRRNALAAPARALDSTWLTYAPDVERFRANLPFLERLRKLAEAGFSRYEFGRWKTRDFDAIAKLNEELGIQIALFTGYPGLRSGQWKAGLFDVVEDSALLAAKIGSPKVGIVGPTRDEKVNRDDQLDELVEALREAGEKVAETEVVLVVEPGPAAPAGKDAPRPLIDSFDELAAVVKDVGSDRVKMVFAIEKADVAAGKVVNRIKAHASKVGHYRLAEFEGAKEKEIEAEYAKVLRAIQGAGYADPIGLALPSKGDPASAIEALRKVNASAKALAG